MKDVVFIIPYFGKFNNYFQFFLNSCGRNKEYNWIIFTDDIRKFSYPENVKVVYTTFDEIKSRIVKKISDIQIKIESPYKLCDYKPLYGYLFEEYIQDYEYWGFCDLDLIFGNLNNFLDFNELKNFDKIGVLGHFTLFKNTKENRELFLSTERYKEVFSSEKSYKFDEEFGEDLGVSINNIFLDKGKKINDLDCFADIYVKSSNFKLIHYNIQNKNYVIEKKDKSFFVWDNGILIKYVYKNKKWNKKEYMYIHLQKRKMKIKNENINIYKIIPNSFENLEECFTKEKYFSVKRKNLNLHYFKIRSKNLITKFKNRRK